MALENLRHSRSSRHRLTVEAWRFWGRDHPGSTLFVPLTIESSGTPDDYNDDGFVDAADYTIFQDNLGNSSAVLGRQRLWGSDDCASRLPFVGPEFYRPWCQQQRRCSRAIGPVALVRRAFGSLVRSIALMVIGGCADRSVGPGNQRSP